MLNLIKHKFMVEFDIPRDVGQEFFDLIPMQRLLVKQYFDQNILISYCVNQNRSKLWAIFLANSKDELEGYVEKLPLTSFMQYQCEELMFHEFSERELPYISLN